MIYQFPGANGKDKPNRQIHDAIAGFLHDSFASGDRPMGRNERWSQQRITVANQEKLADILAAPAPVRRCIAKLTNDIHTEAAAGILLATPAGNAAMLHRLKGESAMTGRLFQYLESVAPVLFAEEFDRLGKDLCLLSAAIEARYDRANLDAEVSELILMYLLPEHEAAEDIADELRATLYAYHEDRVRRLCGLGLALSDTASARLNSAVGQMLDDARECDGRLRAG